MRAISRGLFTQARGVERGGEVPDLEPREAVAEVPDENALARRAAVERVAPGLAHRAQGAVAAHRHPLGRLERHPQRPRRAPLPVAGQGLAEEIRGRHRVDAGELRDELGVLGGEELALRPLAPFVPVRQEQSRAPAGAVEEEVGVGHLDAAEVVEVVRLAEAQVALGRRRSLEEGQALGSDRVEDLRAASGELLRRKVRREERGVLGGGQRRRREDGDHERRRDRAFIRPPAGDRRRIGRRDASRVKRRRTTS